ncbi:MAG: AraC family transcriptional regulator [Bacteroidales bacterium]|nr:AraC family transcriptional regulator [Bacteroidales bacterium]
MRDRVIYGEPYLSPLLIICLNRRGETHADYDMVRYNIQANDLSVFFPNHIIISDETSDNYIASMIVVSQRLTEQIKKTSIWQQHQFYLKNPIVHLDEKQFLEVNHVFQLVKTMSESDIPEREECCLSLLNILTKLVDCYLPKRETIDNPRLGKRYFNAFYEALNKYYNQSHDVAFYADLAHLSPKYFGSIITHETGINASKWIAEVIIVRAKMLLRYNTLNMTDISEQLGFPDLPSFSRYFKTNTGQSPMEYRKSLLRK